MLALLSNLKLDCETKIDDAHFAVVLGNEYISKLQISVHDSLLLHTIHAEGYLRKYLADGILTKCLLLRFEHFNLLIELLTLHVLHEQVDVGVVFKAMKKLQDWPK